MRTDALPGALFASNWVNIFRKLPYFAAAGLPSPLTHMWFLALVMQFYLVWPLLIMAIGRLVRAKWARTVVMVIIVLASSAAMWLLFDPDDTSRVYYGTDTRLAELAMGAMLAMLMQRATGPLTIASRETTVAARPLSSWTCSAGCRCWPMRRFLVHERL